MSITMGAVAGAPLNPAPTMDRPIEKKIIVKSILVGTFMPSRVRSFEIALDTIDVKLNTFLALSREHLILLDPNFQELDYYNVYNL